MTDDEYRLFGEAVKEANRRGWVVARLCQTIKPGHLPVLIWFANVGAKVSDYPKLPIGDLFSKTGHGLTAHEALRDATNRTALRTTGLVEYLTAAFRAAAEAR